MDNVCGSNTLPNSKAAFIQIQSVYIHANTGRRRMRVTTAAFR